MEHGTFTKWHENGKIMIQGTYRNGKKDGLWRECLRDGTPKIEGTYKNGVKEGLWTVFYLSSSQKHFEGMYQNGERDGEWIEYAGDGSVFARIAYKKEKVVSRKREG
ncbi:MAG: toxin-antitoxin system YwqK family antitoxin [Candidatus Caldatribacteriaceae bacterium]